MSNILYTSHATPEQVAQMNQQVLSRPEVQQALATWQQRYGSGASFNQNRFNTAAADQLQTVLRAAGLPSNMRLTIIDGKPTIVDDGGVNWGNIVALGVGGVAGGFALASALGPTATTATTAATATTPAAITGLTPIATSGLPLASTVATAPSIWRSISPTLVNAGANLAGQYMQNRANSQANATQQAALDKELALARETRDLQLAEEQKARELEQRRYDTSRADWAPTRQTNTSALSKLDELMGFGPLDLSAWNTAQSGGYGAPTPGSTLINPAPNTPTPAAVTPQTSPATVAPPQNTLAQVGPSQQQAQASVQTQSSYVAMRAPDGRPIMVPPDRVQEVTARGATPLGA